MSQILWIGCLESDEEFKVKAKKGYDLASAQVSQKNLLYGIEEVSNIVCDSINGSVLPPYPIYEDRLIEPVKWQHKLGAFDISVGYKNDKYINRMNCKRAMIKAANEWFETRYQGGDLVVLVYSMRSAPMATACYIKGKIPHAKIYLIVTDLPQFMDLGQNRLKAILKKIDWKSIKRMQQKFNGFILYAEKMAEYLKISKDKWILMEGSYDISEQITQHKEKKKAVMYSGKLDEQYGINMLLDAFTKITDPDIELWLTGRGNAENYIRECSKVDDRIKFFGFLSNREEVLKKQKEASLLINMRLPSEPASSYCFPSKLFEYMITGTPVLSFDIAGIPREYLQYLCIVPKESEEALTHGIKEFLNADEEEQKKIGEKASTFIIKEKNSIQQCEKIMKFVMEKNYEIKNQ